jgi:hypothetical protein
MRFADPAQSPAQGKTQSKSLTQMLCDYAGGTGSPDSQLGQAASAAAAIDDESRLLGVADHSLVALGNNISRVAGPLGTVLSAGQTAVQFSDREYLNAAFSAADFFIAAALSTTGPFGIGADIAFNASGGSQAAAKNLATLGCRMGGGH